MKVTAAVLVLLLGCGPAMGVNKCTTTDGKVVYQDAPCAGSESKSERPSSAAERGRPLTAAQIKAMTESMERGVRSGLAANAEENHRLTKAAAAEEAKIRAACAQPALFQTVTIGMSEQRFLNCTVLGVNGRFNVRETTTATGTTKVYLVRGAGGDWVQVTNGVVSAVGK